jgi:DNA-directed RNA polymerase specialized sigma24 family protein
MHDDRRGNEAYDDEVILATLYKRLEVFGRAKFGNRIYASKSYQDCLHDKIMLVWRKRLWEKFPSEDQLYNYSCTALNNCLRDAWRREKRKELLLMDEVERIPSSASATLGRADFQRELESATEVEWMKSLFPGDHTMHKYIDDLTMYKKRNESARDLDLTPSQVTNLHKKFKRRVKRNLKDRNDRS